MVKNIRITYRRRHAYRTRSNRVEAVKTPGGNLAAKYIAKKTNIAKCGDCKATLCGLKAFRPKQLAKVTSRQKSVTRAYGGSRCGTCVRNRIVRAFLIEEQKIVKRVVAQRQRKSKK